MAIQDRNKGSSGQDEDNRNNLPLRQNETRREKEDNFSSSGGGVYRDDSPGRNKSIDVRNAQGRERIPYAGEATMGNNDRFEETSPFSEPANQWQPVGDSNVMHWWDSGTRQQQQFFRGDAGYPYRENDWERNMQDQNRIQNFYPQEPASPEQKQNFAEGSQYPYEGGYGANNPMARQGLERAKELKGPEDRYTNTPDGMSSGRRYHQELPGKDLNSFQFRNQNEVANQNQNTMRADDRNFRRDYNDYRNEEQGGGRNRSGDRAFGYESDRSSQRYNRDYDRVRFSRDEDFDRGGSDRYRGFDRDFSRDSGSRDNQQMFSDRRERNRDGYYHSTRTDIPGRGFDREREMNRNEEMYGHGGYQDRRDRNYLGERSQRASSSHRSTGSYEDFERDIDRYNVRQDYRGSQDYSGGRDYDRRREQNSGRNSFNRRGGEAEGNRLPTRFQDRDPRGNRDQPGFGRDRDYEYSRRYDRGRNDY